MSWAVAAGRQLGAVTTTPNALCCHVWICSQVWLNLPLDNCPLFPHLPTDDGHFGYKQKQFAKIKNPLVLLLPYG
jgi:hypothetical protein